MKKIGVLSGWKGAVGGDELEGEVRDALGCMLEVDEPARVDANGAMQLRFFQKTKWEKRERGWEGGEERPEADGAACAAPAPEGERKWSGFV